MGGKFSELVRVVDAETGKQLVWCGWIVPADGRILKQDFSS